MTSFSESCNVRENTLGLRQKHHEPRRSYVAHRTHSLKDLPGCAPPEEWVPEGWGRLSLVCPHDNSGAPLALIPTKRDTSASSLVVNRRLRALHRPPEKTHSLPVPPTPLLASEASINPTSLSSGSLDGRDSFVPDMSGLGGGSAPSSYSTLRRGFKATTSKLIGAASIKKPPTAQIPSGIERAGSERGDPGRFIEGVSFKGKLIGVLEVSEARGDRMCQEALAELKIAVRAAGEHKQRISISVAMDGIRLADERTGDCLYHHPVHKISFIAQDMTDTRAFGYIFGSPDAGHKFFGIKTEKAASQVVIAMRDLFQVVFERKKKEIEKARAQLEEGRDGVEFKEPTYGSLFGANGEPGIVSASLTSGAGGAIADLLDLQSELTSLQRGLSEISKRTQSLQKQQSQPKDEQHFDPFGDSFTPTAASSSSAEPPSKPRITASSIPAPAPLAPPPISGRSRHDSQKSQHQLQRQKSNEFAKFPVDFRNISKPGSNQPTADQYAPLKDIHSLASDVGYEVSEAHRKSIGSTASGDSVRKEEFDVQWSLAERQDDVILPRGPGQSGVYDIFTELDPLGTGKIRPFVDKKDFFNDVRKQTAKKLLRGIGDGEESLPGSPKVQPGIIPPEVSALVASSSLYNNATNISTVSSLKVHSNSTHTTPIHSTVLPSCSDSLRSGQATFSEHLTAIAQSASREHLDTVSSGMGGGGGSFADFNRFTDSPRSQRSDLSSGSLIDEPAVTSLSVGSLTVALPPESFRDSPPPFSPPPPPISRSASGSNSPQPPPTRHSPVPRNRLQKQTTVPAAPPLSPKTLPRSHKFAKQGSYEADWEMPINYFPSPRGHTPEGFSLTPQGEGGISPRPRPRSSLSKQLTSGSATLPLRGSFGKGGIKSPDLRCQPFPSEEVTTGFDEAPEPPPRPVHVDPPPLPPKRLPSHITLRPPPRPPPSSESHYNYINDYDSSPDDSTATRSPPISIATRKSLIPDSSPAMALPTSTLTSSRGKLPSLSDGFQFPRTCHSPTRDITLGAVPKACSRSSTPSKSSTPGKSPRTSHRGLTPESVDLTNTSLDQLASKLNVPVDQLAKMTVVELAACLAQLQLRGDSAIDSTLPHPSEDGYEIPITMSLITTTVTTWTTSTSTTITSQHSRIEEKTNGRQSSTPSCDWSHDKFGFDDDEMFARFDAQFPKSPVDAPDFPPTSTEETKTKFPLGAPVSEDRYAVFRELSSSGKQKSVFDENLLTPQNSMEEETSEFSSDTFKVNFHDGFHQDSLEQKSSISDDVDHAELSRNGKEWEPSERIDHECVTVFRSPDISEYENFEPNIEYKFEDDFSAATIRESNVAPINYTPPVPEPISNRLHKTSILSTSQKSPFSDDFSKVSDVAVFSETKYAKIAKDDKFVANFNDSSSSNLGNGGGLLLSEDSVRNEETRRRTSTLENSPFEDDFSEYHIKQKTMDDSSMADKYDNVFESDNERRSKRFERTSKRRTKKSSSSLEVPNGTPVEKTSSQSPFDDDFSQRTSKYEVLRDLDAERSSPFEDHEDQKSIGSLQSIHDDIKSSIEQRSSPYSETLTPPSYSLRSQGPSRLSLGSEGSTEVRQSPFDDNFTVDNNEGKDFLREHVTESISQEDEEEEDDRTLKTTAEKPEDTNLQNGQHKQESDFADFESAFQASKIALADSIKQPMESGERESEIDEDGEKKGDEKRTNKEDEEKKETTFPEEEVFPETQTEFKISARFPKTEAENIFRRVTDPFSDDFFDEAPQDEGSQTVSSPKNSFWEETFANFKFNNG